MTKYWLAWAGGFRREPLRYLLMAVLLGVVASKLLLIGEGFMALGDEGRYEQSGQALQRLMDLDVRRFLKPVFYTQARPVETLIKVLPTFGQWVTAKAFGLSLYEPANSHPLFLFNLAVYLLILLVHYRLSAWVLRDPTLALLSVILFASMTHSHLYLRHALPYDASLLVLYYAAYRVSRYLTGGGLTWRRSFFLGVLAFTGYLIYPGYFALYFTVSVLMALYGLTRANFLPRLVHSVWYAAGSLACLLSVELLSRVAGKSYIMAALKLSKMQNQGSYAETYTFLWKYLSEVEGLVGLAVMLASCLFLVQVLRRRGWRSDGGQGLALFLGASLSLVYLTHASSGYFLHNIVFYGRLMHQYIPFLCVFAVIPLGGVRLTGRYRQPLLAGLALMLAVSAMGKIQAYDSIVYPTDLACEMIDAYNPKELSTVCEYGVCQSVSPAVHGVISDTADSWTVVPGEAERSAPFRAKRPYGPMDILVVNGCYFYPVKTIAAHQPFPDPGNGYRLLRSGSHFLNFKAYQFEAYDEAERRNLDRMDFQVRVYARPAGGLNHPSMNE
jgi:hypothetical protein